jgi:phosphomannomutase
VPAQMCPAIRVIVGFDGRQGSTDIFSGVVSAACQNGCQVMDVGRST